MKIRILSGRYGMRTGAASVDVKTPADPPFVVSDQEGKRLIDLGVAKEYKEKIKRSEPIPVPKDPTPVVTEGEKPKKKPAAKKKVEA